MSGNKHLFGIKELQFGNTDFGRKPSSVLVAGESKGFYEKREKNNSIKRRDEFLVFLTS